MYRSYDFAQVWREITQLFLFRERERAIATPFFSVAANDTVAF